MKIESVRLSNVDDSYMVLRHMDSFEPAGTNKYIVLDLSTEDALVSVLKQVGGWKEEWVVDGENGVDMDDSGKV